MKVNEAPKKIYVHELSAPELTEKLPYHIEYVRKDAFIEEVSGWLKDCATFTDMNGKKRIDKEMYKATVEDFKKYMEGDKV